MCWCQACRPIAGLLHQDGRFQPSLYSPHWDLSMMGHQCRFEYNKVRRTITNVQTVLGCCDCSVTILPKPNTRTVRETVTRATRKIVSSLSWSLANWINILHFSKRARLGVIVWASGINTIAIIRIVHDGGTLVGGPNAKSSGRHRVWRSDSQ